MSGTILPLPCMLSSHDVARKNSMNEASHSQKVPNRLCNAIKGIVKSQITTLWYGKGILIPSIERSAPQPSRRRQLGMPARLLRAVRLRAKSLRYEVTAM